VEELLAGLLGALGEVFLEVVLQVLFEGLIEVAWEALAGSKRKTAVSPWLSGIALLMVGAAAGGVSAVVFPQRLTGIPRVPGLSLILAPLVTGTAMQGFGNWRRSRGRKPSRLASFWGGAAFAFGMALVRFLIVGIK
jgi:hypothetical protein